MSEDKPPQFDLSIIRAPDNVPADEPDAKSKKELRKFQGEAYRAKHDRRMLDEDYRDKRTEVQNRSTYTNRLYWLMVGWMVVVLGIILLTGLKHPELRKDETGAFVPLHWYDWFVAFDLPEGVLLALIGGTTANVIGLFLVVARYLFPRRTNGEK